MSAAEGYYHPISTTGAKKLLLDGSCTLKCIFNGKEYIFSDSNDDEFIIHNNMFSPMAQWFILKKS